MGLPKLNLLLQDNLVKLGFRKGIKQLWSDFQHLVICIMKQCIHTLTNFLEGTDKFKGGNKENDQ